MAHILRWACQFTFIDSFEPHALQQSVEPLLDAYKPPGLVKKIYFKTLTFGDAPFKIDNVWVDKANDNEVCLEVCTHSYLLASALRCTA